MPNGNKWPPYPDPNATPVIKDPKAVLRLITTLHESNTEENKKLEALYEEILAEYKASTGCG